MGEFKELSAAVICPCPTGATFRKILTEKSMSWFGEDCEVAKHVKKDMPLFIFVSDAKLLWGIYKARDCAQITGASGDGILQTATVTFETGCKCHPLTEQVLDSIQDLNYSSDGGMSLILSDISLSILWQAFYPIKESSASGAVQTRHRSVDLSQSASACSTFQPQSRVLGFSTSLGQDSRHEILNDETRPTRQDQRPSVAGSAIQDKCMYWQDSTYWRHGYETLERSEVEETCQTSQVYWDVGERHDNHGLYTKDSQVQTDKELFMAYISKSQSMAMNLEAQLERIAMNTFDTNKRLASLSIEKNDLHKKIEHEDTLIENNSAELKLLQSLLPEPPMQEQIEQDSSVEESGFVPSNPDRFEDVPWRGKGNPTHQNQMAPGAVRPTEVTSHEVGHMHHNSNMAAGDPVANRPQSHHTVYVDQSSVLWPGKDETDQSASCNVSADHSASILAPSYVNENSSPYPQGLEPSTEPRSAPNQPRFTESNCQQAIPLLGANSPPFRGSQTQASLEPMRTTFSPAPVQVRDTYSEPGTDRAPYHGVMSDGGLPQSQQEVLHSSYVPTGPGSHQASGPIYPIGQGSPNLVLQQIQSMQQNQGNPANSYVGSVSTPKSIQQPSPRSENGHQNFSAPGNQSQIGSQASLAHDRSPCEAGTPADGTQSPVNMVENRPTTLPQAQGDLYMLGGSVNNQHLGLVEKYHDNGLWQDVGKLPDGLVPIGGDACSIHRCIYVVGLHMQKDIPDPYGSGAVHRFDVDKGQWDTVANVDAPRTNMRCVNCQNNIVLAGGDLGGPSREASDVVQVFDACKNLWLQGPKLRRARYGMGLVCIDQVVFAIGGVVGKYTPLESVEMWDMRQKSWTEVRSMDQKRGFASCASVGEFIFALGGFGPNHMGTVTNRLQIGRSAEYFETRANKWTSCKSMSDTRAFGTAASLGGYIWAIGGRRAMDDIERMVGMERFDLSSGQWKSGLIAGREHTRGFHMTCIIK